MTKSILFTVRKGGVGKTTLALNEACLLALQNKKVLVIDLDPQGNSISSFNQNPIKVQNNIYDLKTKSMDEVLQRIALDKNIHLDVIAANSDLINVYESENGYRDIDRIIDKIIKSNQYDYVIIDTNPAWNNLIGFLMLRVNLVVFPIFADIHSTYALDDLDETIANAIAENPKVKFAIVPNRFTIKKRKGEFVQDVAFLTLEHIKARYANAKHIKVLSPIKNSQQIINALSVYGKPIVCNNTERAYKPIIKLFKNLNDEIQALLSA